MDKQNKTQFYQDNSFIHCSDCRNNWFIKQYKLISNLHCKHNKNITLFNNVTKNKLSQKCI